MCGLLGLFCGVDDGSATSPPKKPAPRKNLAAALRRQIDSTLMHARSKSKLPTREDTVANPPGLYASELWAGYNGPRQNWYATLWNPSMPDTDYLGAPCKLVGYYLTRNKVCMPKGGPFAGHIVTRQESPNDTLTIRTRSYVRKGHKSLDEWLRNRGL